MYVDELGFVYPIEKKFYKENHFANSQIFYRLSENNPLIKTKVLNIQKIRGKNNCWICEGWNEIKFDYKPENINKYNIPLCKIYLNFEGYKPYEMEYNEKDNIYECYRMCPPSIINFYYTLNDIPVTNYNELSKNIKESIIHIQEQNEKETESDSENDNNNNNEKEIKKFILNKVGEISKLDLNDRVIIENRYDYYKYIKFCVPRPEKKKLEKKKQRMPWSFPISIWYYYGYKYDGEPESIINEAFEFDYKRGQYFKDKDLPYEQEKILKEYLRSKYYNILNTYKNLSSYLGWKIWQVGQNQITDFATRCPDLLDNKYLINDVLVKVTEVKSNMLDKEERKKTNNIPDNIIRHQFMMLLVRIAKDKYYRTKTFDSILESVQYAFEKHYDPFFNKIDNHLWRIERYYNENVDNLLKAFIPLFYALFYSNVPQKIIGRKDSHWMWLDEFTNLCNYFLDSDFPVKEIPTIFCLSFRLTVNEINSDKHYNMNFYEFLEAFCRFIDKLSPIPKNEDKSNWPMEKRMEQPLNVKLENILYLIPNLIKGSEFKNVREKFVFPSKDEETGLYIIDYNNEMYKGKIPMPKDKKKKRKSTMRK